MATGKIEKIEENTTTYASGVAEHTMKNKREKSDINLEILGFETKWWERGVLEVIHIRKVKPSLNADNGRYNLSKIWDNILLEELKEERRQATGGRKISNNIATDM